MDDDAKDRILDEMNVERRGFESELRRVLIEENNQDGVSSKQRRQLRDRMTSTKSHEGGKVEKWGHTYVEVDKGNYRRVTSKDDIYEDENGNVWLRDAKGRFKKKVK